MSVQPVNVNAVDNTTGAWWISAGQSPEPRHIQAASVAAEPQASKAAVSSMARMLAKLDTLVKSDPTKFADVTSQIAAQLAAAAKATSGSDSDFFGRLAEQFKAASRSGDVSSLEPRQVPMRGYNQPNGMTMDPTDGGGGTSAAARRVMDEVFATIGAI